VFEIGESLAAARRAQRLELVDVEALTRIRQRNLAALEAEHFDALPGRAYTRAFLRTYATALGLEADQFVAEFEHRYPEPEEAELHVVVPRRRRRGHVSRRVLVTLAVLGALVGIVAWSGSSHQPASFRPLAPPPAKAAAVRPAHVVTAKPATHPVPKPTALVIRALRGDCWLLVRRGGAGGPVVYEGTLARGESLRFGKAKVWVRFGAPWNVAVRRGTHGVAVTSKTAPQNLVL